MKRIVYLSVILSLMSLNGAAQNISGSWRGVLEVEDVQLPLVFNITPDGQCTIDSPKEMVRNIPGDVNYLSGDSISVSTSIGFDYAGRLLDGVIHGTFSQNGLSVPMDLKLMGRPQSPQPPFPYQTELVKFTNANAGATLAGTLTVPDGAKCVLLMVTGSGSQNRDEELFEHKPFAVIADRLARQGIATLRYDDRGYGESVGGEVMNATTKDFADDAAAGIEWLRRSGRFQQVGILGHSEGGSIAFMLGAQGLVDFIVSLAGPTVQGDSILLEQNRALFGERVAELTIDHIRNNPQIQQVPWYQFFVNYNPQTDIAKISCPVMAINGEKDVQVMSGMCLDALRRVLPANEHHLIKSYPGLNHLFQHCETGMPDEYEGIEETISEEVINDIISWLHQVAK
jgi:pimeloyl-ACP methyl ester carboxylesterase